jgi:hypothetical protein
VVVEWRQGPGVGQVQKSLAWVESAESERAGTSKSSKTIQVMQ